MAISTFWRLILSHMGILLLSGAACLYSIVQLGSLSGTARSTLDTNHRMISYQEALTDAFLSQVRYGGKYLITHAQGRYEQLRQFKKDFMDYLEMLKRLGQSDSIATSLLRIERFHGQYHDLFDREVDYIHARQNYAQTRYQQERDKIAESTLNELDLLKAQLRTKLQEKLESIDHGARTARRITIATTFVVFIFGTFLSLRVSRSIDGPRTQPAPAQTLIGVAWIEALKSTRIRWLEQSRNATNLQARVLTAAARNFLAIWNRRATIWKNSTTRKGS